MDHKLEEAQKAALASRLQFEQSADQLVEKFEGTAKKVRVVTHEVETQLKRYSLVVLGLGIAFLGARMIMNRLRR